LEAGTAEKVALKERIFKDRNRGRRDFKEALLEA